MSLSSLLLATTAVAALACAATAGVDVKDYGTKGDGSVDDSAAIQSALDAAAEKGGPVLLGVGRFRLDKPLNVPEGVILEGVWEAPHHAQLKKGTVFEIYAGKNDESAAALVTLNPSSAVKGITFFYPEQRIPGTIAYPYTIHGKGMHCSVMDCTFVNPYKAMDFGTDWNELHYIRNCFGCPLKVGVHIDRCTDIGRIENVHFNPHYWGRAEVEGIPKWDDLLGYIQQNLIAFEFARTDWEYVHNTFCYGAKIGYRFYQDKDGTVNGNFLGIGADWCGRAVLVEQCQMPGLLITNGEFVGGDKTDAFMEIAPTNTGVVQFGNCSYWGPCPTVAIVDGPGTTSFNQCAFLNHGQPADRWTIDGRGGDVTIQACRFGLDRPGVKLAKGVKTAVIVGNRFAAKQQIENNSEGDVQMGLNVVSK